MYATVKTGITDCGFKSHFHYEPLEVNLVGDCQSDIPTVVATSIALVNDFKAGDMTKIMADGEKWYTEIIAISKECTDPQTTYDAIVTAILAKVTLPAGANLAKCTTDAETAYPDLYKFITDVQGGDQNKMVLDLVVIFSLFKSVETDCMGTSNF